MTVMNDVLDGVVALVEGSAGSDDSNRTISRGRFVYVDNKEQVGQNKTVSAPYPFCIQMNDVKDLGFDGDLGVFVSGTYQWERKEVPLFVLYTLSENKSFDVYKISQTDYQSIKQCLEDPLNLALTTGWVNCNVSSGEVLPVTINGETDAWALRVLAELTFREALS